MTEKNDGGWGPGRRERLATHRKLTRELIADFVNEEAVKPIKAEDIQILSFKRTPARTKKTMFNWHTIAVVLVQLEGQTMEHASLYELNYNSDRRSIWIGEYIASRDNNVPFRKKTKDKS